MNPVGDTQEPGPIQDLDAPLVSSDDLPRSPLAQRAGDSRPGRADQAGQLFLGQWYWYWNWNWDSGRVHRALLPVG
jgi:hypothetical protein